MKHPKFEEFFDLDKETGFLFFAKRDPSYFKNKQMHVRYNNNYLGKRAGSSQNGYEKVQLHGKIYFTHKVVWYLTRGEWVEYPHFEIDHIDGNSLNNIPSNLRKVTKSQNQRNAAKRTNNTSGVHGVNWKPKYKKDGTKTGEGRWLARIWDGPKHVYLGEFRTIEEAKKARDEGEKRLGYTGTNREPTELAIKRSKERKSSKP